MVTGRERAVLTQADHHSSVGLSLPQSQNEHSGKETGILEFRNSLGTKKRKSKRVLITQRASDPKNGNLYLCLRSQRTEQEIISRLGG